MKIVSKNRFELEEISLNYNLKYILSILNSKLARYYLNSIRRHRIEYYFYPDDFKNLPIKRISLDHQMPFIEKADLMLQFNKDLMKETNSFKKWLQLNYRLEKFSKKIDKYYELELNDFLKELKKKKVKLKPKDIRELEEEFNSNKDRVNQLNSEIIKVDNEINQMVYELYGLTDEEIKIIEASLN